MTDLESKGDEPKSIPEAKKGMKTTVFYRDEEGNLKGGGIRIRARVGPPEEEPFVFIRDDETGEEIPVDAVHVDKPKSEDTSPED